MQTSSAIVWSQNNCQFCGMAKWLLTSKGYEVEERKIGDQWTKQDLLNAVPSARSVPQIFINNEFVGGYPELVKFLQK